MPDNYNCVVRGCPSRTADGITLFQFPASPGRAAIWANNLGLSEGVNVARAKVCYKHFKPCDLEYKPKLIGTPNPVGPQNVDLPDPENQPPPHELPAARNVLQEIDISQVNDFKDEMERKIAEQKEKVNASNVEKYSLKRKIHSLKEKVDAGPKKLTRKLIEEHFQGSRALCDIILMQYERYGKDSSPHYSYLEKSLAITLFYSCGKNGYRTLSNLGLKLPSLSTLRRWICKLKFTPGRCTQLLDLLKNQMSRMNDFEKDCVLMFDETQINSQIIYNRFEDKLEGIAVSNGEMKVATQALVIMLRGMNTNFKFPLSYHFSSGNMKTEDLKWLLTDTLADCMGADANVVAVCCDQAPWNCKIYKELGVDVNRSSFMFQDREIFAFYDAPHLIKNIRNNLMDHGYLIPYGTGKEFISWDQLKTFYEADCCSSTRLSPKLTEDHLEARDSLRMRVSLATQVLSSTVAAGIETMVRLNLFSPDVKSNMMAMATFCRNFDFIFDYLNIGTETDHKKSHRSARKLTENFQHIIQLAEWVSQITKHNGKRGRIACLDGVEQSLRGIVQFVKRRMDQGYGFVLTRRLQSDCLENFFGMIKIVKGTGKHPTSQQFRRSFRYLFCTMLIKGPMGGNCEQDFEEDDVLEKVVAKMDFLLNWKEEDEEESDMEEELDEFESSCDDSNDDERTSYAVNKFFASFGDLVSTPATANATVYLGDRAVKAVVTKKKCLDCKSSLLEFLTDRESSKPSLEEYFHSVKANEELDHETDFGFTHLLQKPTRDMFVQLDIKFPVSFVNAMNPEGTNVVRNIVRELLRIPDIREWQEFFTDCQTHRKLILCQFVRTRIYSLMKQKNCDKRVRFYQPSSQLPCIDENSELASPC